MSNDKRDKLLAAGFKWIHGSWKEIRDRLGRELFESMMNKRQIFFDGTGAWIPGETETQASSIWSVALFGVAAVALCLFLDKGKD